MACASEKKDNGLRVSSSRGQVPASRLRNLCITRGNNSQSFLERPAGDVVLGGQKRRHILWSCFGKVLLAESPINTWGMGDYF
jgi:hypothetical protein